MLGYIFILGNNWILSLSEIIQILKTQEYKGRIKDYSACVAIVEFDKGEIPLEKIDELIFRLGGTQKICKIVDFIQRENFYNAFPESVSEQHPGFMIDGRKRINGIFNDIVYPIFGKIDKKIKYFVANSIYPVAFNDEYYNVLVKHFLHFANKTWVKLLKEKGARSALYYRYPEENIKSGNLNPIFPHHFIKYELFRPHKKEIVYALTEEGTYIGYTLNVSNSNELKMIDEERPYKNVKASIPPKFAKILINYLDLKRPFGSRRILDPFCGTGTILLFAYIQGIQIYGSDSDIEKVRGTRNNIKWIQEYLEKPLSIDLNKNIIQSDISNISQNFEDIKFDGIVSEPILLPFFTELPTYEEVENLLENKVIPNYKKAFSQFTKLLRPKARFCITLPSIDTLDSGRVRIEINRLIEGLDLKPIRLIDNSIISEKSDQRLSLRTKGNSVYDSSSKYFRRQFFVFENL